MSAFNTNGIAQPKYAQNISREWLILQSDKLQAECAQASMSGRTTH